MISDAMKSALIYRKREQQIAIDKDSPIPIKSIFLDKASFPLVFSATILEMAVCIPLAYRVKHKP